MSIAGSSVAIGVLLGQTIAVPAMAVTVPCATSAQVRWEADASADRVLRASVAVPGCADGTHVGLTLVVSGQLVPSSPLNSRLDRGSAAFDLRPLGVTYEPLTGVEVSVNGETISTPGPDPEGPVGPPAQPVAGDGGVQPATGGSGTPGDVAGGTKAVPASANGQRPAQLPFSGFELAGLLTTGGALTAAGLVLELVRRRRAKPSA